jgi:deoxycytidylate deaminase
MGPCAKSRVFCRVVAPDGREWMGENHCLNPQEKCPREPGEGYEKCQDICQQVGHAEQVAASMIGNDAIGGTAYLIGHYYACEPCARALREAGLKRLIIDW